MVSQRRKNPRRPTDASSRDRLLAAAAEEFAARGFDGAKVERITRRARVNKAMLYYHFTNKAALHRAIVGEQFSSLAAKVTAVRERGGEPADQLRAFIATIAAEMAARPHFPSIWLREMAEGGRHIDATLAGSIRAIVGVLGAILHDGYTKGVFRPAHPLVTQMGIVAPLLLFLASAPLRERFKDAGPPGFAEISIAAFVAHIEAATLAVLAAGAAAPVSVPRDGAVARHASTPGAHPAPGRRSLSASRRSRP